MYTTVHVVSFIWYFDICETSSARLPSILDLLGEENRTSSVSQTCSTVVVVLGKKGERSFEEKWFHSYRTESDWHEIQATNVKRWCVNQWLRKEDWNLRNAIIIHHSQSQTNHNSLLLQHTSTHTQWFAKEISCSRSYMQTRKYRFRNIPMRRKAKRMPRLVRVDCFECVLDEYFWNRESVGLWDFRLVFFSHVSYYFRTKFERCRVRSSLGPHLYGPHLLCLNLLGPLL